MSFTQTIKNVDRRSWTHAHHEFLQPDKHLHSKNKSANPGLNNSMCSFNYMYMSSCVLIWFPQCPACKRSDTTFWTKLILGFRSFSSIAAHMHKTGLALSETSLSPLLLGAHPLAKARNTGALATNSSHRESHVNAWKAAGDFSLAVSSYDDRQC